MAGRKGKIDDPRKIAVLRALRLGDMLCAVPALRALRAGFPSARIVLVGLPWARDFAARFSAMLDGFLEFPGFPGLPERNPDIRALPRFLMEIQEEEFDLVIQLHGDGRITNGVASLFGGRRTAGLHESGCWIPDEELFIPVVRGEPEVRRFLRLTAHLGLPDSGEELEFPILPEDRRELAAIPGGAALRAGEYACIHPGARDPARRWPPDRFAAVADALAARGLGIAITGGPEETEIQRAVADRMAGPSILIGEGLGVGGLGAAIEGARILVTNDTGVSHLSAALRTPSVVLFGASDPGRWAPLDQDLHRTVCPRGEIRGDPWAPAADAIAEARSLLEERLPAA
jgi:ADP-heptose:LPS heptosyltransferase